MIQALRERMDRYLYREGYALPEVRELMRVQVFLALLSCAAALAVTAAGPWGLSYTAGAALVTANFASLAKFAQQLVYVQKGAVVSLLVRFYGRLLVTGLILYGLIAWGKAPVAALLAGLSTVLVTAVYWGAARFMGHNVKEA